MRRFHLVIAAALLAVATAACVVVDHGHRRRAADGVELSFDERIGVYAVVGRSDCWWDDDRYYSWHDGVWLSAAPVSGPWTVIQVTSVPSGLRARGGRPHHGPGWHGHRS